MHIGPNESDSETARPPSPILEQLVLLDYQHWSIAWLPLPSGAGNHKKLQRRDHSIKHASSNLLQSLLSSCLFTAVWLL